MNPMRISVPSLIVKAPATIRVEETHYHMTALNHLEARLRIEAPALEWQCRPSDHSPFIPGTEIPEQIEITATVGGEQVADQPWRLRGGMLVRWGLDSTARLVAKSYPARLVAAMHTGGHSWDKLAEI